MLASCSEDYKEDLTLPSKQYEISSLSATERSKTLAQILSTGVSVAADFETLRNDSIYPFYVISNNYFNEYLDSTTFHSDTLCGDRFGLHRVLTLNQYKIWWQIALHKNIYLDYLGGTPPSFVSDIPGEQQYQDQTGYSTNKVMPLNKSVIVDDLKDCPIGDGGCTAAG